MESLAEEIGISKGHLCNILTGRTSPSCKVAQAIMEVTKGLVTLEELLHPENYTCEYERQVKEVEESKIR
jgi:DNA-binding transcriptional regulator YdaS (Cro superfamily)